MNNMSYTDEQLLNLVNNSILKHTEFLVSDFSGGSISVTSVHKNTRQNYKVNLYFGYKGKNSVNRSFDIKDEFYFIWCKAVHLKVMSIASDNLGADFNELNEMMQSPKNESAVDSSKLDSSTVVSISTEPDGTLQGTIQEKKKSLKVQTQEKLSEYDRINYNAFNEWIEYKKYKSISPITKLLNMLDGYSYEQQQQMVDASIMNGWAGLFAPKDSQQQKSFAQQHSDEVSNMVDAVMDNNFDPFDPNNYPQQEEMIDVQPTKRIS